MTSLSRSTAGFAAIISFLLYFIFRALGLLPIGVRATLGRALGRIFSWVPTQDRTIASLQLQKALGPKGRDLTPLVYANLGQTILECLNLRPLLGRAQCFNLEAIEQIRKILESRQNGASPVLCLTGHVGNWELLAALAVHRGIPLSVIGREARSPAFQGVLARLRQEAGLDVIWRSSGARGARQILKTLKSGRVVAALIDQDTRVAGTPVNFFGFPAQAPTTIIELAQRCKAEMFSAFMTRSGLGGTISIRRLPHEGTPAEVLDAYHQHLEEIIREHPDQWVWMHKRWRTMKNGERLSSRHYISWLKKSIENPLVTELHL